MTNLFLTVTLLTNTAVAVVTVSNTQPLHIYSIQTSSDIVDTNLWVNQWLWYNDTAKPQERFFSYTPNTNTVFYRAVDKGIYTNLP